MCVGCLAAGSAPTTGTSGLPRGQAAGGIVPLSNHARTAFAAQPDGSAVVTLWPTPGTTSRWPCGNRETTDTALPVGVRMSKPPLSASTGTFGSGPALSVAPPDGLGHFRQKSALPKRAAHVPNGPNV